MAADLSLDGALLGGGVLDRKFPVFICSADRKYILEPSSLSLFGLGLLGIVRGRRRDQVGYPDRTVGCAARGNPERASGARWR